MPELPDIEVYLIALRERIEGQALGRIRLKNPFLLRTAMPPIESVAGRRVVELRRIGKRIVMGFEGSLFLVVHLMIAGRLQWRDADALREPRNTLAVFEFDNGHVYLTEAGSKRRASLHLVADEAGLDALDPGGLDVMSMDAATFVRTLRASNHTLKRALTDPHIFSGIGNAYSDEILHAAKLSPLALTSKLSDTDAAALFAATRATLAAWIARLSEQTSGKFPEKVTAFHHAMAVHGRYGKPCPVCGAPIQRIVYADNETNYCARCQTGGRILADRALSRLLHDDWPRNIDELG
ncbi:MAG TPA: DNA-formamidopyrimidine glycosylase family protein [Rhodanobacteraceae bacterium]|jgi:formamidopyrimidine-DNA glycosylase|nr:DNA-formamidopyrimidine glycosylase family protein [Rhodanobacteraceae bacterium]